MKKQRCLGFAGAVLLLVALVCLLPFGVEAETTNYLVESIHLRVEQPVAGYTPRFEAWIEEDNPNYYLSDHAKTGFIGGISWMDETTGQYLTEDSVFVKGHSYTVGVLCNTKTGYEYHLARNEVSANYFVTTYINGQKGNVGFGKHLAEAGKSAAAYYTFTSCPAAPAPLTQVAITGIETPHHLSLPDRDVTAASANCRIAADMSDKVQGRGFSGGVAWCRPLGGGYTYTLSSDDAFEGGNIYRVEVLLEAVHPYRFAVDSSGNYQVTATAKGYPATVRDAYGYLDPSRYCLVTYEFPVTSLNNYCILDKVEITNLDVPVPGKTPDYTVTTTTGGNKRGTDTAYMKNGIVWYDASVGANMKTTDVFQEGHVYTAKISLQAAEGYLFKDDASGAMLTTAAVNGQPASVINELLGPDKLQVNYTFPVCQKIEISKVNITIKEPKLAEKGSYNVTFDVAGITTKDRTDALFSKGVGWWDNAENTYLEVGQRFAGGRSYNLEVYLALEDGYAAAKNMTVTVNGKPAEVWGGNNIWVTYETAKLTSATGWYQTGKDWVFFGTDGSLRTGWMLAGSVWYYFDEIGTMATGWKKIDGKEYYFNASGAMYSGWLKEAGVWYYLKPGSGDLAIGWLTIGGKTYYFMSNGRMVTGSVEIDGKRYQFDSSGALVENTKNGWVQENGKWFYYQNGGKKTGWLLYGKVWYYLKANGEMVTGWLKYGNVWYYLKPSGEMQVGWLLYGKVWYYMDANGEMVTGSHTIGGKTYNFDSSGVCLNP